MEKNYNFKNVKDQHKIDYAKYFPLPNLDREEEKSLILLYKETRDFSKAQKLIDAHFKLLLSVAYKYYAKNENKNTIYLDDLVQEGYIGILRALEKYDVEKIDDVQFSTYAKLWIKAFIDDYVDGNIHQVHVANAPLLKRERKFYGLVSEYSLNQEINNDDNNDEKIGDLFEDDNALNALEVFEKDDLLEYTFKIAKNILNDREYKIFVKRNIDEISLEEVGKQFKISRERVRQIEKKALEKIKLAIKNDKLKHQVKRMNYVNNKTKNACT